MARATLHQQEDAAIRFRGVMRCFSMQHPVRRPRLVRHSILNATAPKPIPELYRRSRRENEAVFMT